MAGRFVGRVKAWAAASGVPVIFCKLGERKHLITEEYLKMHVVTTGDIPYPGGHGAGLAGVSCSAGQ